MVRVFLFLIALSTADVALAQRPLGPDALIDGTGSKAVYFDPGHFTGEQQLFVAIDTMGSGLSPAEFGAAVDRLLDRSIAHRPLPSVFRVMLGGVRDDFERDLRRRLTAPGANWNLATGQPRRGDYGTVVQAEYAAIIAASPLAAAFRRHGYTLHLDSIARLTEGDTPATRHLPGHIDEVWITAHRGTA